MTSARTLPNQRGSHGLRCLFALELGGNFGHLTRCLALAKQLRDMGNEVLFAVPDSRAAFQLLTPHGFSFIQAPRVRVRHRKRTHPINCADLLLHNGYSDTESLSAALRSWLVSFQLVRAEVLISDFAPTALLAARVVGLPAAVVDNGFFIPPDVSPWPSIRPWQDIPVARLQAADDALLVVVNSVLRNWQRPAIQLPFDLFSNVERILATFSELDHYGHRTAASYAGVFYGLDAGKQVDWPAGSGKRILAYLRGDVPGFGSILQSLRASGHRIVLAAPGTHAAHVERFSAKHLYFSNEPIAIRPLLESADLAVGYGSIGFVTQTMRYGLPQLMLPKYVEQALFARRVDALGAGIVLADERGESVCTQAIDSLLEESRFHDSAHRFAARYSQYDPAAIVKCLADNVIAKASASADPASTAHSLSRASC